MTFIGGEFDNTSVEVVEHIKLMIDARLIEGEAFWAHAFRRIPSGFVFRSGVFSITSS
jgi:hypothetical protein